MENIIVEVCAASVEDALVAQSSGAHRIELNSAMPLGGLTPSIGLTSAVLESVSLPVIAMLRPRESGFCYSDLEFQVMMRDAAALLEAGVAGLAVGFLDESNHIDETRCRDLRKAFPRAELVFHRAFDFVVEPMAALESLIDCDFQRILTSGSKATAIEGISEIAQLVQVARDRIQILPGSGITTLNASEILAKTGARQIHGTFSGELHDCSVSKDTDLAVLPADSTIYRRTDAQVLQELMATLNAPPKED